MPTPSTLRTTARRATVIAASTALLGAIASAAQAAPTGTPFGNFERASGVDGGVEIKGWTIDPDTANPVNVRVTVDGSTVASFAADGSRPDVANAYPTYGDRHGFRATVATSPGERNVCVTALNVGQGENRTLHCYDVTVTDGSSEATSSTSARPDSSNTGVPAGTQLKRHSGDLYINTPGTVIDGLDIYGTVSVRADNVTIKNSRIRGRVATYNTALVSMNKGYRNLVIKDTEIAPDSPSPYLYGIMGWEFTLERVNIHHVVDSLHIYGNNVNVRSSYLHNNVHYQNDPNFGGGATHDDGIQILAGTNIQIVGSRVEGAYNAAVQITQDKGRTSNVSFVGNWFDGGGCSVNISEKGRGPVYGLVAADNTFGRNTRHYDCAMITPDTSPIKATGNYFTDGAVAGVRDGG